MNTKKLHYLAWLTMGMAVCLTTSSCTTCDDATLYAVNTRVNPTLASIPIDDSNCLIQVDMQLVTFQLKDIEKLQLAGNMTSEALLRLWKAGKAKLTATASAVVELDQEAIVKVTQEIIYPSEFNVQISDSGTGGDFSMRLHKPVWVPEPQNFTMREMGLVLQILPHVEENACITLKMKPQWVTLDQWISHGPKNLFRQPVFGMTQFETQVTITDGDTILLGSGSSPDGKSVNVGFLTAKKVKVQNQK